MTKGPSQGAESLCWPVVRWISRSTRSPSWKDLGYLSVVVSAQALLVDGGPAECQQLALFQQIDAIFLCFFCLLFGVHGDSRGVKFYVRRDDGFGTVHEEERREVG